MSERKCGPCYACCVHLGIDELKKWPGQSCCHLDGALGPETRCSIYPDRPHACRAYKCAWLEGMGGPDDRPDKSGLLVTPYLPNSERSGSLSVTITVIDHSKCGTLHAGPLHRVVTHCLNIGSRDIRIVSYKSEALLHLYDGALYRGKILKAESFEELKFATLSPPIGKWLMRDVEANVPVDSSPEV